MSDALLTEKLLPHAISNTEKERMSRFRLSLLTNISLAKISTKSANGIMFKINSTIIQLANTKIQFEFNNDTKFGIIVNFESTVNFITKHLTATESSLKTNIIPLLALHNIQLTNESAKKIKNTFLDIAPYGYQGIEPDYYYRFQLLLSFPSIPAIFDDIENPSTNEISSTEKKMSSHAKQWHAYAEEFFLISHFLLQQTNEQQLFFTEFLPQLDDKNFIKKPFKVFINQKNV